MHMCMYISIYIYVYVYILVYSAQTLMQMLDAEGILCVRMYIYECVYVY